MTTTPPLHRYLTDPCNYPALSEALAICDGHSIFDPKDFHMLPEYVRDHFSKVCESEPPSKNPKRTIYLEDGSTAKELYGIYGLDLIESVAKAHHIHTVKNGRGFRANDLKQQITDKVFSQG